MHATAPQLSLFPPDDPYLDTPRRGGEPPISIRESARARRLSIKVFPRGGVEVVVPRRTRASDVAAFVAENAEWIRNARDSFAAQHNPEPFALPQEIELPAIGRRFTVRYVDKPGSSVRYQSAADCVTVSGNIGNEKLCVAALRRFLAGVARREFAPRLENLATLTGIGFSRLQVRAQRTCWGSRSSSGTLSLNLCLLFLPPELVRYLMIHELCHGRHMNHSKRFWNLVARFEPRYRELDKALAEGWKAVPSWLGIY